MTRMLLAAAAAFALLIGPAAYACDCKDCPHKAAAAEKSDAKGKAAAAKDCPCHGGKDCKCGPDCKCEHCAAKKAADKKDEKKT